MSIPSVAPCSVVLLRLLSSSRDFSAAYHFTVSIWAEAAVGWCSEKVRKGMRIYLSEVIVLPLALLDEIGQLRGQ